MPTTASKPVRRRSSSSIVSLPPLEVPGLNVRSTTDLQSLVPDPEIAERYVNRYIDGHRDTTLLQFALSSGFNVLIEGPTGPGKTMVNRAFAAENRLPMVTIQANGGVDVPTFWGQPRRNNDGEIEFVVSSVIDLLRAEGPRLLLIDEVNFLHPKISAAFYPVLDDRRELTIPELLNFKIDIPDGLLVVATYNDGYFGTRQLNQAFKNKFEVKLGFDYDPDIEEQIVGLYEEVAVDELLSFATGLRERVASGELSTPVSTNMLVEFVQIGDALGYDFAKSNFLNAFAAGEERDAVSNTFDANEVGLREIIEATAAITEAS